MTVIDAPIHTPTTPAKRHHSGRIASVISSFAHIIATDDHEEASYVQARVGFMLGIRKQRPTRLDRPELTLAALDRQAETLREVVILHI